MADKNASVFIHIYLFIYLCQPWRRTAGMLFSCMSELFSISTYKFPERTESNRISSISSRLERDFTQTNSIPEVSQNDRAAAVPSIRLSVDPDQSTVLPLPNDPDVADGSVRLGRNRETLLGYISPAVQ